MIVTMYILQIFYTIAQCSGSMTFWCRSGSGSADPCLWLMDPDSDPDPDPAIFVIDLQDANKKLNFCKKIFCLLLFECTFTSFLKEKKSQNSRNQGSSYYFCMMIEGSGSGSIPLTDRSGSRRPKKMWIRWIRNTAIATPHRKCIPFQRNSPLPPLQTRFPVTVNRTRDPFLTWDERLVAAVELGHCLLNEGNPQLFSLRLSHKVYIIKHGIAFNISLVLWLWKNRIRI